ncbi:hypothetical protein PoB_000118900 [Plakobranchus ocellatus]|uniref:Uncharacterized protein n=1 Tax=Plakobranchus ocellatus TaxID=259542 RepID=A0AAV3XUZ9_9GAST|nr:hypothetical protein PoB_000118900 [Plakobranchus ocellatus]
MKEGRKEIKINDVLREKCVCYSLCSESSKSNFHHHTDMSVAKGFSGTVASQLALKSLEAFRSRIPIRCRCKTRVTLTEITLTNSKRTRKHKQLSVTIKKKKCDILDTQ